MTTFSLDDEVGDLTLSAICTVLVIIIYALLNGALYNHAQIIQRMGTEEEDSMTNEEFDTTTYQGNQSYKFRSSRNSSDSLHEDLRINTNLNDEDLQSSPFVEDEDTLADPPLISRAGLFDYSPDDTMEETLSNASSDYRPRYSFTITPEEARIQKKLLNKDIFNIFNIDYISDEDNDNTPHDYFDFKKRSLFPKNQEEELEDISPLYNEDYGYEDENDDTEEDSSLPEDSEISSSEASSERSSISEPFPREVNEGNLTRPSILSYRSSQPFEHSHIEVLAH